ncbi:hypothetical protein SODALDRAFT_41057 [Sodiomyces alkalinus F11]|uniref:Uncharacterized protein n=1 Tax=Sodiomyces alkalinus (strain CBS 110278 / VKM F-3762 / F11) TaxID=1314773 RepID=A0A3N2Q9U3_SODAK|nr:hypothetical protein SODALDRAFT_41057 [Sodiomyces alkalinus F11]ROT43512.1 hypothetical protein SODALDRAFT_41057 [Sodiomyces alkalinus F11]
MYGSYGSYSSMSPISMGAPLDVTSSSMLAHDRSCAFPSWPHRDSLSATESGRPSSYLSDDDLFPSAPVEDDARSVSSSGSSSSISPMADDELLRMERERQALQREAALRYIVNEKERRRQAMHAKRQRARQAQGGSSSSGKASKSKLTSMTPIAEAGE